MRIIEKRVLCETVQREERQYSGVPAYVVYYWTAFIESGARERDGVNSATYTVTSKDRRIFPELEFMNTLVVWQDDEGQVNFAVDN